MKRKALLSVLFFMLPAIVQTPMFAEDSITSQVSITVENKAAADDKKDVVVLIKDRAKKLYSLCTGSLLVGAFVGAFTGSAVGYIEKKFYVADSPIGLFLFILSWVCEPEFRHEILSAVQMDFSDYGIAHNKNSMNNAAWIASWLAYCKVVRG